MERKPSMLAAGSTSHLCATCWILVQTRLHNSDIRMSLFDVIKLIITLNIIFDENYKKIFLYKSAFNSW